MVDDDNEVREQMAEEERRVMLGKEIDRLIERGILEECIDEDGRRYIRRPCES